MSRALSEIRSALLEHLLKLRELPLTDRDEKEIRQLEARLVATNMSLGYKVPSHGLEASVLGAAIQRGLLLAIRSYNPQKGAFSTHAMTHIRAQIQDELRAQNPWGLKRHDHDFVQAVKRVAELLKAKGLSSTPENIVKWAADNGPKILTSSTRRAGVHVDDDRIAREDLLARIEAALSCLPPRSLESSLKDEFCVELPDQAPTPEEVVLGHELPYGLTPNALWQALDQLSEDERFVIMQVAGLVPSDRRTRCAVRRSAEFRLAVAKLKQCLSVRGA